VFPPLSVPTTLIKYEPGVAPAGAETVNELGEPPMVVEPGCGVPTVTADVAFPNVSVAAAERLTLPDSVPAVIAATVADALPPGRRVKIAGLGESVKPAVTNRSIVVVDVFPLLSVPVTVML
jgi:hypothetical protein